MERPTTTTNFSASPVPPENVRRLLDLLFAPLADTSQKVHAA